MKYQATRDGQFIGAPQKIREDAQKIIDADKKRAQECAAKGWISSSAYLATRWNIRKVK